MAEITRFRIKKGDLEIEYEGPTKDASARYAEAIDWLKEAPSSNAQPKATVQQKKTAKKSASSNNKKDTKRGGSRSAVISPAIDDLIEEGFFDDFKTQTETTTELKRKTIPVSGITAVINALNRRVPKILDRIKNEDGNWVYRKKEQ